MGDLRRVLTSAGLLAFALVGLSSKAVAAPPTFVGIRAQGMGGALRAAATGDSGPMLNPSGMSLMRMYVLEGAYQYLTPGDLNVFHGSIVDSLSNQFLSAGLSYTYQRGPAVGDVPSLRGHEVGLSLSAATGPRGALGATLKYLHLSGGGDEPLKALTFDVGATFRPVDGWAVAIVGTNLRNLSTVQAPVTLGGGIAYTGLPGLVVDADVLLDFGKETPGRDSSFGAMAGAEYLVAQRVALRLGGGRDPILEHGYVSAGLGMTGGLGAIDAGWRQDVSGTSRHTYLGVSVRLFAPEAQPGS